jgi:glycosyltransferase involved in cell wall biosynthesis
MSEKILILFTTRFPVDKGEPWLTNEVKFITGEWKKVMLFCDANTQLKNSPGYPQFSLLPNTFTYKRNLLCFFNRHFLDALYTEAKELINEGKFGKLIFNSISVLMRKFEMAKWFTKNYINKLEEYMLYSYWGNDNATMMCFVKLFNKNTKAVCRVHRFDIYEQINRFGHIMFRKFQLMNLSAMFSVSEAGTTYIRKKYPSFKAKIKTSYLGTSKPDSDELNPIPQTGRLELITCAMVSKRKKLDRTIKTLENMKAPVRWTMVGDGQDMQFLKDISKDLPKNVMADFQGYLNANQIMDLYKTRAFHYYISTSDSEGLPVAMMESISFGVPIISTDVGGCDEIVNQTTGKLVPPGMDEAELANIIEDLYLKYNYSQEHRNEIFNEWDNKFNAGKNYQVFYKQLSEIS